MGSRISVVNQAADRVLIVANPSAGARSRKQALADLVDCLTARGLAAEIVTDLSLLTTLVDRYHDAGELRAVVAAGGDGTVAEIVNRTHADTPVTVYPCGTANLLANYFALACEPESLTQTLIEGATVRLDAGKANGRIFLLMVGCGFDADVVERLHRRREGGHISYWTWALPILDSLRNYKYPALRVSYVAESGATTEASESAARWAFMVNLPCYAGGLEVAPEAVGNDGLLNVCTFGNGSFWHALRYFGFVALRRHRGLSDFKTAPVKRVRIESDQQVPYQLDGDPGGFLPLEVEVLPQRMTLVAPFSRILALGLQASATSRAGAV